MTEFKSPEETQNNIHFQRGHASEDWVQPLSVPTNLLNVEICLRLGLKINQQRNVFMCADIGTSFPHRPYWQDGLDLPGASGPREAASNPLGNCWFDIITLQETTRNVTFFCAVHDCVLSWLYCPISHRLHLWGS